jgi:hypothetical protein
MVRPVEAFFDEALPTGVGKICSSCLQYRGLEAGRKYDGVSAPTIFTVREPSKPMDGGLSSAADLDDSAGLQAPPLMPHYQEILGIVRGHRLQEREFSEARDVVQKLFFGTAWLQPHARRYLNRAVFAAQRELRS